MFSIKKLLSVFTDREEVELRHASEVRKGTLERSNDLKKVVRAINDSAAKHYQNVYLEYLLTPELKDQLRSKGYRVIEFPHRGIGVTMIEW